MKTIIAFITAFGMFFTLKAQDINFLNYSICNPQEMSSDWETNEYIQGGGHNYYLSYSLDENLGSYSPYNWPYGTEENPMIIYIDSTDNHVEKTFYHEKKDITPKEKDIIVKINPRIWEPDYLVKPSQDPDKNHFEETVLYCKLNEKDNPIEDEIEPEDAQKLIEQPQVHYEYEELPYKG